MTKRTNKLIWLEQQKTQNTPGQPPDLNIPDPNDPNKQGQQDQPDNPNNQQDQPDNPNQPLEPVSPDMPQESEEVEFNKWKDEFFKLAVQGDVNKMLDSITTIRDQDLNAAQTKFVEDNYQISLLRQDANFDKVSKSIRKSLKTDLDQEHPGTSLMQIISPELESNPVLGEILIKLFGFHGMKGELHRKFIAALTGSVQVGGGASKEDIVFNEKEYSINISTRIASTFGEINIGKWSLQETDTNKFLSEPEVTRLQEGSPEEKKALVHRIILESIAEKFKTRAFLIHVVMDDGNVYSIGWDLGDSLKDAYKEGKIVIKSDISSDSDMVVNEQGDFIKLKNLGIYATMDSNETDEAGKPKKKEVPFIENRSGILYFVADLDTVNTIGGNISGLFLQSRPYTGSPVEFKNLTRKVPGLTELLLRR